MTAVAFDADNAHLVLGDRRGGINEFDLDTGSVVTSRYVDTSGGVAWMWMSYDGAVLFAMTDDGALRRWDTATGTAFAPIWAADSALERLGAVYLAIWLSWSGEYVVVATEQGWRQISLLSDDGVDVACARAGRNLTRAEWNTYLPSGEPYHTTCAQFPPGG